MARLIRVSHGSLIEQGPLDAAYVEVLGVVVICIDESQPVFEPLREPSQYRPRGVVEGEVCVPMLDPKQVDEAKRA